MKRLVTPEQLRELLDYSPDDGRLFWRWRPIGLFPNERAQKVWNTRYAGAEAFTKEDDLGYRRGCIFGADHFAHRVAWAWMTGEWPTTKLDHIDRAPSNNRFQNLRAVSDKQSALNRAGRSGTASRFKGVHWFKPSRKWAARLRSDGRLVFCKYFDSEEDAARAYDAAARRINGPLAYVNFS